MYSVLGRFSTQNLCLNQKSYDPGLSLLLGRLILTLKINSTTTTRIFYAMLFQIIHFKVHSSLWLGIAFTSVFLTYLHHALKPV